MMACIMCCGECVNVWNLSDRISTISRPSFRPRHRYPHLRRFFFVLRSFSSQFRDNNYTTITFFCLSLWGGPESLGIIVSSP
jgi:hypothetical protein